tara:strand:+ start:1889 stop:2362 length:474 start_codon:yes stop_codon:yes gene_type:complete
MFRKIIFSILVFYCLSGCGYTPLHSQNNNLNFTIINFKLDGNSIINNYIEPKLKKYEKNDSERKFELKIKTDVSKFSVGKDSKGNTTNLKLVANLDLNITEIKTEIEKINKTTSFSENITIKKSDNNYEQSNYEQTLIKNMSELLFKRLIFYLSRSL